MAWTKLDYSLADLQGKRISADILNTEIIGNIEWLYYRDRHLFYGIEATVTGTAYTYFNDVISSDGGYLLFDIELSFDYTTVANFVEFYIKKNGVEVFRSRVQPYYGDGKHVRIFWIDDDLADEVQSNTYEVGYDSATSANTYTHFFRMMAENIGRQDNDSKKIY